MIVFAGVRNQRDADRLAHEHENVRPIMLDVSDAESIDRAAGEVRASGVALCGIVANAGIAIGGPLEHLPIAELRRQFEVNVFGLLALTQAFVGQLAPRTGRVVFVGSISGRLSTPYIGPYSASKFAVRALADALRIELAPCGISVSLIEPGSVKTPIWQKGRAARDVMLARLGPDSRSHYRGALERIFAITEAEERGGLPVEVVARAILHALASRKPRASYVLGTPARLGTFLAMLPPVWRDRALRASMRLP